MDGATAGRREWVAALWHALPISVLVVALYWYWFAIADRYIVFLYYHDMGPLFPDTSPFGQVTSSRYWMTGLVCGGMVLVLYAAANWVLGRTMRTYDPPAWWRTWALAAAPLIVGIPLITMLANDPTLPLGHAARTTLAAIVGLGLAVMPARMAAQRPWELLWLAWDGLAMGGIIQVVSFLERVMGMWSRGQAWGPVMLGVGLAGAVVLLLTVTWLRRWRRVAIPGVPALLAAGLSVAYLVWPLIHYLGFTDGYYYITDMDNFFSRQWGFQFLGWAVAGGVAWAITKWRTQAVMRRDARPIRPPAAGHVS